MRCVCLDSYRFNGFGQFQISQSNKSKLKFILSIPQLKDRGTEQDRLFCFSYAAGDHIYYLADRVNLEHYVNLPQNHYSTCVCWGFCFHSKLCMPAM